MSGRIKLDITQGPMQGKEFLFDGHDTFLFGRMSDCHACLPNDDQVSRHHFILEVNPPDACLRDLGSLNGTHVNKVKHGGRAKNETPEQGALRQHPEVALKDGDEIMVGQSVLKLRVEVPAVCCECSASIPDVDREKCSWVGGTYICTKCKSNLAAHAEPRKAPVPVRCKKCGKDVAKEIGQGRRGDYICQTCQKQAEADPLKLLEQMLRQAGALPDADKSMKVPGYAVEKLLQRGGFGAVYSARRKMDSVYVAIKVMLSKNAVDEKSRKTFLREIENLKALQHAHIVPLLDSGSAGHGFYFVMEFCEGGSVADLMGNNGGKLPLSEAGPIMLEALEGLAYAHSMGFVHRDLKPGNVLLGGMAKRRTAKVSDFGLAKNFEKAGFSGHTLTGNYAGTPHFMPREQVVNYKYMKPVSDVWSSELDFFGLSDRGLVREQNEDAWIADIEQGLFLVSDGMGGQFAGGLASKIVVEVLPQILRQRMESWHKLPASEAMVKLRTILAELSGQVRQKTEGHPGLDGMGATVVLALIRGKRALIAHMGDSRVYLFRKARLKQLTKDHTVARLLVESGDITEEEAIAHPTSSQLSRFMGMKGEPLPEVRCVVLNAGDRLFFCTDGLTRMLNDRIITSVLCKEAALPATCKSLIAAANDAGGRDNVTAVLVAMV